MEWVFTAIPVLLSTYRTLSNTDWYLLVPASYGTWYCCLQQHRYQNTYYVYTGVGILLIVWREGKAVRVGRQCYVVISESPRKSGHLLKPHTARAGDARTRINSPLST